MRFVPNRPRTGRPRRWHLCFRNGVCGFGIIRYFETVALVIWFFVCIIQIFDVSLCANVAFSQL